MMKLATAAVAVVAAVGLFALGAYLTHDSPFFIAGGYTVAFIVFFRVGQWLAGRSFR